MTVDDTRLWTPTELGAFLGLSPNTVTSMCSRKPDRLPPRLRTMSAPRWLPSLCIEWARTNSAAKRKIGRPRQS